MLIRSRVLTEIAAGRVRLAFRRWRRPTVVAGGTLRTAVGVRMLAWIAAHPGAAAARLARHLKREVPRLKADVRKLKDLGLTESLSPRPGYRLSKRGAAFLRGRVSD